MITPINTSTVTEAIEQQLREHIPLASLQPTIERSGTNDDPNRCPWIGIYRISTQFPPRLLGAGAGVREQQLRFALAVQQSDFTSGEQCEVRLEELLAAVVGALLSDHTLRGTVLMLGEDFSVTYPDYKLKDGAYMQTAIIEFTAVGRVSIT